MINRGLWGRIWGIFCQGSPKLIVLARVEEYGVPVGAEMGTDLVVFCSPPTGAAILLKLRRGRGDTSVNVTETLTTFSLVFG